MGGRKRAGSICLSSEGRGAMRCHVVNIFAGWRGFLVSAAKSNHVETSLRFSRRFLPEGKGKLDIEYYRSTLSPSVSVRTAGVQISSVR